ncbi:MAG: hypothetical protein VW872_01345, partial [Candidatus Poseidoniales archaeon]
TWLSSTEVRITNPSALSKPYAVGAYLEHPGQGWTVSWDCDGETTYDLDDEGCGADLLPKRTAFFWMNLTWDGPTQPTRANLSYVVSMNDAYDVVPVSVRPALEVVPDSSWYDVEVGAYVHRCVALSGDLLESSMLNISVAGGLASEVQTPLVSLVGGAGMNMTANEVPGSLCLQGLDPLVFDASMASLTLNNDTFSPLLPPRRPLMAHVPADGWTVQAQAGTSWEALLGEGGVLNMNADHCPINASISTPARPQDNSPWIWDLEVRSSGDLPLVEAEQNLTLQMPSGANMSLCKETYNPYPSLSFSVVEGPELLATWMGSTSRFWTTPWAIASNGTVLNEGMTSFTLHNPTNTSVPFRLDRGGSFGEDWSHDWDGNALEPGTTTFELVPPDAPLATMWLSYEADAVVLHLSSYQ